MLKGPVGSFSGRSKFWLARSAPSRRVKKEKELTIEPNQREWGGRFDAMSRVGQCEDVWRPFGGLLWYR